MGSKRSFLMRVLWAGFAFNAGIWATGCRTQSPPGLLTHDGLGEHGHTSHAEQDRGPFFSFEDAHTLRLAFLLGAVIPDPDKNVAFCYRPFVEGADRRASDANIKESADDNCAAQTGGWIRVPLQADADWIFTYGSILENDTPFPLRLDDYTAGHYQARVDGLSPATRYEYRVVYAGEKLANRVVIRTPLAPDSEQAFDFAAIADLRSYDGWAQQDLAASQLSDAITKKGAQFVILPGDVSNESGTSSEYVAHYFQKYNALLRTVPFYPVQGNHDLFPAKFLSDTSNDGYFFFHFMPLPSNPIAELIEHWDPVHRRTITGYSSFYSFDWGRAHFVALDRTGNDKGPLGFEDFGKDSIQYAWLSHDLDLAQSARWRIAYFHNPPERDGSPATQELLALLKEKNVDLVVAGHYERPELLMDDPRYVPWVILPSGGSRARNFSNGAADACSLDHTKRFGIATFHVEGDQLTGMFTSSLGEKSADFTLQKSEDGITSVVNAQQMYGENCN